MPSCQSSIRTHGQGVWLPAHVQGIECVDTVGGKTLFATAGVADPLPEAYGSAVEDFGVPLRNVEVPFTVVKDTRGGQTPVPAPGGRFACVRGLFSGLDQAETVEQAPLHGGQAFGAEALGAEPLPQAVSVVGGAVPGHVGQ